MGDLTRRLGRCNEIPDKIYILDSRRFFDTRGDIDYAGTGYLDGFGHVARIEPTRQDEARSSMP